MADPALTRPSPNDGSAGFKDGVCPLSALPTTPACDPPPSEHILIVDDLPANNRLLEMVLVREFKVSAAQSGAEALRLAAAVLPDLILLDVMMPEMDGHEVLRRLQADPRTAEIPVIFITALVEDGDETDGLALGAADYITKPIRPSIVLARVRTQLELQRARRKLAKSRAFLNTILNAVPDPIFVKDRQHRWLIVNDAFCRIMGQPRGRLLGKSDPDFLPAEEARIFWEKDDLVFASPNGRVHTNEEQLTDGVGNPRIISTKKVLVEDPHSGEKSLIGTIRDITEFKKLLARQEINIGLARNILRLIDPPMPRAIPLGGRYALFVGGWSVSCNAEGGDHFFVRSHPAGGKTLLSLKDQSGHEVNCVLKSIVTNLLHHAVLAGHAALSLAEALTAVNAKICRSGLFREDDFLTSVDAEIDHATLGLTYATAGHPPFVWIRGQKVELVPARGAAGGNLPMGVDADWEYRSGNCQLAPGDKLIFYTDGLTEMPQAKCGKVISPEELRNLVSEIVAPRPELPVSQIAEEILMRIARMSGETVVPQGPNTSADDVSMLYLEVEDLLDYEEVTWQPADREGLLRCMDRLYASLRDRWETVGFDAAQTRLRVTLEEALLNAWKHGNRRDPTKTLTVRWRMGNDFCLEVLDQGAGFDPQQVPDPTRNENLTRPSGRGIAIMRHFADAVDWQAGGRQIRIWFCRKPDQRARAESQAHRRLAAIWPEAFRPPS